jgi:pyruvate,water dikinase
MVQAEAAAVAFSVNPVTGRQDQVVVEAVPGLGTGLVGGTATPARYLIHKQGDELEIVERHPAENPILNDEQAIEVARLAVALERHEGRPVDVECAYQDGTLYLLQCRPVTTKVADAVADRSNDRDTALPAVEWDNPADAERTWSGGGGLLLPLQQSLSLQYYQGWAKAFRRVDAIGRLRSRIYCGREYRCWEYHDTLPPDEAAAANLTLEQQVPQLWAGEWLPLLQYDLAEWASFDWSQVPDDALGSHLQAMLARQTRHWEIHAVMGWVPLRAVQRVVDGYLARFPGAPESEPYRLLQGQGRQYESREQSSALGGHPRAHAG